MFFRSFLIILRWALRCAFAYLFRAFRNFLSALREARLCAEDRWRGCALAWTDHPTLNTPSKVKMMAASRFIRARGITIFRTILPQILAYARGALPAGL